MSYWTPRGDAPIRTCPGGKCERRTDCRRFLERTQHDTAEMFLTAPYREVQKTDETGRPLSEKQQVCEHFTGRAND